MTANGKQIEKQRKILNLSKETLISRVQTQFGVDLNYRSYDLMIRKGVLPKTFGEDILNALSKIFNCNISELGEESQNEAA